MLTFVSWIVYNKCISYTINNMPNKYKKQGGRNRAKPAAHNNLGYTRVAAVVPKLALGNPARNAEIIITSAKEAAKSGAQYIVFPELSITGYSVGDLFHQELLQKQSIQALKTVADGLKDVPAVVAVGLPLALEGKLFNVAALIYNGQVLGFVPKTYIPGYKEFYEERWFASARDLTQKEILFFGRSIPIGTEILFRNCAFPELIIGIEICEDVWAPLPPSSFKTLSGATLIANLSASNELVGKADYRRELIAQQSARTICGYIYVSCGVHESTTDVVFGGHALIAENGNILKENERFRRDTEILISDIDLEHLKIDRIRTTSFGESVHETKNTNYRFIDFSLPPKSYFLSGVDRVPPIALAVAQGMQKLERFIDPHPFIPGNPAERDKRAKEIFSIQTAGLAKRLEYAGIKNMILGLSGGLDSTLALLVAVRVCGLLKLPLKNIMAFTMPGFGTGNRTKSNAIKLAESLGVSIETIDITKGTSNHLKEINHGGTGDVTYQNAQARYRTMILMDKANQLHGLVIGTGDLSEIALGWSTFTGDHISHYNVNAGIPKLLVRYLVQWVSEQDDFVKAKKILRDVLDTPISPELTKEKNGEMQKTEDLIGPYELHDFFLYHFVRWGSEPKKILFLAEQAFGSYLLPEQAKRVEGLPYYSRAIIKKWLRVFIERFFKNQWKRSVMPDGPKVGSVALSPRGDLRMPSDVEVNIWLESLESVSKF